MVNNPLVLTAVGGAAIAAAIAVNVFLWQDEVVETAAIQSAAEKAAPGDPAKGLEGGPAGTQGPSFDVIRVEPGGDTVMAGRAKPGSVVVIIADGKPIGEATADGRGEWVFVPTAPLKPGNRELSLEMRLPGGKPVASEDVVVVVVPERDKDVAGRPTGGPQGAGAGALALKMPRSGGATTVMQTPGGGTGEAPFGLSVEALDYDDKGQLSISGRAAPGARVNVYLDNGFIGRTEANADGQWRLSPDVRIKPGLYTLRADLVDNAGKVAARLSMPFSRAEAMGETPPEPFVIVQPGNSLWRLARRAYGAGVRYTTIFEANKEQIKDPDLIYPGQVFAIPATN